MLAAQLVGPRKVQLGKIDKPACGKNTLLIKVNFTAICGTDLHTYRDANVDLPRIMGHETAGIVVEKGENSTRFAVGDRVVVNPIYSCGQCLLCQEGKEYLCTRGGLRGRDSDGNFTEYILADEIDVFKIPEAIPLAEATQIQTLSTVYHGQKRLHIEPGKSVLVVGMGVTGFLHLQLARASGATPIIAVDNFPWKLDLAKKLGADEAILVPDATAIKKIKDASGGQGPDAVIEAVGIPPTVSLSIDSVAPGGKVLLFGVGHQPLTGFDPYQIYFKEIKIIGTRAASRIDWPPAINLVTSGGINLKPLVTHIIPLKEIQKAFTMMDESAPGLIRVAVEMPE